MPQPPGAFGEQGGRGVLRRANGRAPAKGLHALGQVLLRSARTVQLCLLLGACAGLLFSLLQTPSYQALTRLAVGPVSGNVFAAPGVNPASSSHSPPEPDISAELHVLTNPALLAQVLERPDIQRYSGLLRRTDRFSAWRHALGWRPAGERTPQEAALVMAAENVTAQVLQNKRVIEIRSEWPDPQLAAAFANALADAYLGQKQQLRAEPAQPTSDRLIGELQDLRTRLERSAEALQRYGRSAGFTGTGEHQSGAAEWLRQRQADLSRARAERAVRESLYQLARTTPPQRWPSALGAGALRGYIGKLADRRRQLAKLASSLTDEHHKVKQARAEIAEIETAVAAERSSVLERTRHEYEAALRREQMLQEDYEHEATLVSQQKQGSMLYSTLRSEFDASRELCDHLLRKVTQMGAPAARLAAGSIRVIERARPPSAAHRPNYAVNALMGLLSGLLLGVVIAFVGDRADGTVQQPGELAHWTYLPELGVIPAAVALTAHRLNGDSRISTKTKRPTLPRPGGSSPDRAARLRRRPEKTELTSWQKRATLAASYHRATATSILLASQNGEQPQALLVTSPGPGEGKTTVVSNLGICLAETGRRVLIVDADLRKPRFHNIFEVPNHRGFSDLLEAPGKLRERPIDDFVHATKVPDLYLLTSGKPRQAVSSLLRSQPAAEVLRHLLRQFDAVLIDTPPMLEIADARLLAGAADSVVLVARAGQTSRRAARAAALHFREDGCRVLGTVLNFWTAPASRGLEASHRRETPHAKTEVSEEPSPTSA